MKFIPLILGALATVALSASAQQQAVRAVAQRPAVAAPAAVSTAQVLHLPQQAVKARAAQQALAASFSVQGKGSQQAVWSENFDGGSQGWTLAPDADKNVNWTLKKTTGAGKAFSEIDSSDVQSLYVDGPYRVYQRAIAHATSPVISVPANGMLHAWVGFSQNFSDECSLTISVSTDGFATSTTVWSSLNETGESNWRWHQVEACLAEWAGQKVQLRLTYGPGSKDTFNTGGYMGDFAIDGLSVTGVGQVDSVSVATGERVRFVDTSAGETAKWQWSFPGGTPAESTEAAPEVYYTTDGNYDVTLTVTDASGTTSTATRKAFVKVTGEAPVAHIGTPATFLYRQTGLPFVAPLAPVQYADASTGYPTSWQWSFSGTTPAESSEQNPWVSYDYLHTQSAVLKVKNQHGESADTAQVSVEYEGYATNVRQGDTPVTYSLEDKGVFPGSNRMKITEYAERFSKPSRPIMVYGAAVFFATAQATALTDQIADVGVHLRASEGGLPGKKLDSSWWRVFELETGSASTLTATTFEFAKPQVVKDEFFLTVDGIPESNDSCNVSFATARLRNHHNTALMKINGNWRELTGYFDSKGSQTSYYIMPLIAHSVITMMPVGTEEIEVGRDAGIVKQAIYSYYGYKTPVSDSNWCRVVSKPNGLTLDTLQIQCDALPQGIDRRVATLTFTDSIDTIKLRVVQSANSGITATSAASLKVSVSPSPVAGTLNVLAPAGTSRVEVYSVMGRQVASVPVTVADSAQHIVIDASAWAAGTYVARVSGSSGSTAVKFVKN